jgi:rRNA-processing protein FCF1
MRTEKEVVFDSSFLMAVMEKPTTWYEDILEKAGRFRPVVLDCVLGELKRIADGGGRRARFASLACELAGRFETEKCGGVRPDDEIISYARSRGACVATVDSELIRAAKAAGLRVVTLRRRRVCLA